MLINLFDNSKAFNNTNKGVFNGNVENNVKGITGTKSLFALLEKEKNIMENNSKFIDDLKSLLRSYYNNDVELLAKRTNISLDQIKDCLAGTCDPIPELVEEIQRKETSHCKNGDYIQIGDKIEINNSGEGYTNNYDGMMKGYESEVIKKMKIEITELRKTIREKDKLLTEKERLIEVLMTKKE